MATRVTTPTAAAAVVLLGCLRPEEVFPGFPLGIPPAAGGPPPRPVPLGPELTPQKRVHRAAVRVWRHTAPRHQSCENQSRHRPAESRGRAPREARHSEPALLLQPSTA